MNTRLTIPRSMLLLCGFLALLPARAGCVSDCREEYDSAVDSCRNQYDEPDDADDLRHCIDNAKDEYDDCINECKS